MAIAGVRNLCFFLGAIVILAVLYSSTSIPTVTSHWQNPATTVSSLSDKFKHLLPEASTDPLASDEGFANPPAAVLGVPNKDKPGASDASSTETTTSKEEKPAKEGKPSTDKSDSKAKDGEEEKSAITKLAEAAGTDGEFNEAKYAFQADLKLPMPDWDAHHLRRYMPRNYKGPGHPTFATYYSTRNGTVHDPYFLAALQLTYRILWDPKSKSEKYPLTVFVAPFTSDEQRNLLQAAGAIVRELDLVEWHPNKPTFGRWKDLFSKINMWRQTDFELIAFLDLDAFPVQNIDEIFDIAERQKCRPELLPKEDKANEKEICEYVFSGTGVGGGYKEINVGVMVFNPNNAMRDRLMRQMMDEDKYDAQMAEQAFLSYSYRQDGPFPCSEVSREWNGFFPQADEAPDSGRLKIIHEKLWAENPHLPWAETYFSDVWKEMLKLYNSPGFTTTREKDGRRPF